MTQGYTFSRTHSEPDSGRWTQFVSDNELIEAYDRSNSFEEHARNFARLKRRAEQRRRDGVTPDHGDDFAARFSQTYAIRKAAYGLYKRAYGHDPEAERKVKRR